MSDLMSPHTAALIALLKTLKAPAGRYKRVQWSSVWWKDFGNRNMPGLFLIVDQQISRPGPWTNTQETAERVRILSADFSSKPDRLETADITEDHSLTVRTEELRSLLMNAKQLNVADQTYGITQPAVRVGLREISGDLYGVAEFELEITRYEAWSGRSNNDPVLKLA